MMRWRNLRKGDIIGDFPSEVAVRWPFQWFPAPTQVANNLV